MEYILRCSSLVPQQTLYQAHVQLKFLVRQILLALLCRAGLHKPRLSLSLRSYRRSFWPQLMGALAPIDREAAQCFVDHIGMKIRTA